MRLFPHQFINTFVNKTKISIISITIQIWHVISHDKKIDIVDGTKKYQT